MGTEVDYDGVSGYRADPVGPPIGGMILIHEIWGLVPHIRAVADRWAGEGWVVVAPDLLSDAGVTPDVGQELQRLTQFGTDEEKQAAQPRMREAFSAAFAPEFARGGVAALQRVVDALADEPAVEGRIVTVGFCFGGTYAFELAAADDRIAAAVPFYGSPLPVERIPQVRCPILAIYGDQDVKLMETLSELEDAMTSNGKDFTTQVYLGAQHAFFNDTGARYDAEAAEDAWATANAFLRRALAED